MFPFVEATSFWSCLIFSCFALFFSSTESNVVWTVLEIMSRRPMRFEAALVPGYVLISVFRSTFPLPLWTGTAKSLKTIFCWDSVMRMSCSMSSRALGLSEARDLSLDIMLVYWIDEVEATLRWDCLFSDLLCKRCSLFIRDRLATDVSCMSLLEVRNLEP